MPKLRILWVCNNMLFGLPAELAKLIRLVELEADGNVGMQVCIAMQSVCISSAFK